MGLLEVLQNRHSVRKYTGEMISEEQLKIILSAGLLSASSRSICPWELIVVRNKETLHKLSSCRIGSAKMLKNADAAVIVIADHTRSDVWIEDCSIVMSNMHLMADSLGIGSCWIQGRLREAENGQSTEAYIRSVLDVPENFSLEAILSLGMPTEHTSKKELSELLYQKIHYESFRGEHGMEYYIASCVFTSKYPELSKRIQEYIIKLGEIKIVRCCTPKYKLKQFAEKMPDFYREKWCSLPDSGDFSDGDTVYSICHNCTAILSEIKPNVNVRSLWKLILEDKNFGFPDYTGRTVIVQDCWRSRDNREEQEAVRELLDRMNIRYEEMPECYEKVDFCGTTLYSACIPRNMVLAPDHFVKNADGKFIPHSDAEKKELMKSYCQRFEGKEVLSYCHYCQEGLKLGGANAVHLAELLFVE